MREWDIILIGGGLANGLIASRIGAVRPDLRVLVIESGQRLGANHTWSYHETDMPPAVDEWVSRIARFGWSTQEVSFPAFRRHLETGYRTLLPDDLNAAVTSRSAVKVILSTPVVAATADSATIAGGQTFKAPCVIDGRGLGEVSGLSLGYQTFMGLEIETQKPHGVVRPMIMDAAVAQHDCYRFFYVLPMTPTRLLVEDTYYADAPALDLEIVERRIRDYIVAAGWEIASVERYEQGLLPIVLEGSLDTLWARSPGGPARVGMRAGLFHQTTGYSLPLSAVVADCISMMPNLTTTSVDALARGIAEDNWSRQGFFRMLNRLLFIAARPDERLGIMQRFYGLDGGLIERFYAGRLLAKDMARILVGRPPIPIPRAIGALSPRAAMGRRATLRRADRRPLAS